MAIIPYLYYQDAGAALEFLSVAFGFKKFGRPMFGADGKVNHAAMKFRGDVFMMGTPPGRKYKNPKRLGQATQSLYINVPNVDKHFANARKAGATIIEEPVNTEYGHRRYGAEDPEGHQWFFAQEIRKARRQKGKR
jgi:uncharacterized glyoxalase superfamily protein PhnB